VHVFAVGCVLAGAAFLTDLQWLYALAGVCFLADALTRWLELER